VFVERSARAVKTLQQNIKVLAADGAVVRQTDALDYLDQGCEAQFDIVFLDPPFAAEMLDELCRLIAERQVLADDACVYLEQDRSKPEPVLPVGWCIVKNKTAGNVRYMLVEQNV
jgi:16S rRNA (guanine966-N2)-methyltransferase